MIAESLVAVGCPRPAMLPCDASPPPLPPVPSVRTHDMRVDSPLIRPSHGTWLVVWGVGMGDATESAPVCPLPRPPPLPRLTAWHGMGARTIMPAPISYPS